MVGPPPTGESNIGTKMDPPTYDDHLYIHPSNNTITMIVNFKLTGTKNFHVWHSSMTTSLKRRNKLGFMDGPVKKDYDNNLKSLKWERVNLVVCSWILGSLSKSIYSSHAYFEFAQEIWNELFETLNKVDGSVVFNIHQHINSLNQKGYSPSQ